MTAQLRHEPTKAVIYCRVSSTAQATQGHGLQSQESRCRSYAKDQGYEVVAVFPDDASGGGDFMKRPGMVALLSFLDAQPDENYVVIFDDLKRFVRDTEFHMKLRRAFKSRQATVECLNFKFEDTPEGRFIETILAAQGALEREQNGRQVSQKMRERMKAGYWVFPAPVGYKYETQTGQGRVLIRDEPIASIVQEALEGYAIGRFRSYQEIADFLTTQAPFPKSKRGIVRNQEAVTLCDRTLYAGHIQFDRWDIPLIKARHEPIISLKTFYKIQDRRKTAMRAPIQSDITKDFPLRGIVGCASCGKPLTGAWANGRSQKYAYYSCAQKDCPSYRKSLRKGQVEDAFVALFRAITPRAEVLHVVRRMLKDAWSLRQKQMGSDVEALKEKIGVLERKIDTLADRIFETESEAVIAAYEKRIETAEREKLILIDQIDKASTSRVMFSDVYEPAMAFLSNPWKLWESGSLKMRKLLLKLVFPTDVSYCPKQGVRTANLSSVFKYLREDFFGNTVMVEHSGIEPLTSCMPCRRSPS